MAKYVQRILWSCGLAAALMPQHVAEAQADVRAKPAHPAGAITTTQAPPTTGESASQSAPPAAARAPSASPLLEPPPASPLYAAPTELPSERSQELTTQLQAVDDRLFTIERGRREPRIAGPIVMMASGYGVAFVSGLVALASFTSAEDIEHGNYGTYSNHHHWRSYDINDDGVVDHRDERQYRRIARGLSALSLVSLGVGIGGTVLFTNRMQERRREPPELRALRKQRRELLRQLEYGANLTRGGTQLSLKVRF